MNISSLISSANFKPLNLMRKGERNPGGEPPQNPAGTNGHCKENEDFAVILERTKQIKRQGDKAL